MRTFPFDSAKASGLPALITIEMALTTLRFTTADHAVIVDGVAYPTAPGADLTGLDFPSDGTPANADIVVATAENGLFARGVGVRGFLDGWPIRVDLFDPNDTASGSCPVVVGTIGSVEEDTLAAGMLTIAANGQLRQAAMRPLTEHYSLTGLEDLGDDRCKIPILLDKDGSPTAFDIGRGQEFVRPDVSGGLQKVSDAYGRVPSGGLGEVEDYANVYYECTTAGTTDATTAPTYSTTPGDTVTDGTATFIVRDAWSRYARGQASDAYNIVLTALPDSRASDNTWFVDGGLFIRSGTLAGTRKIPIRAWDPGALTISLFLPIDPADVPANTQFELYPGCDHTPTMCAARFLQPSTLAAVNPSGTNIENIRATYFVPTPDLALSLGNA